MYNLNCDKCKLLKEELIDTRMNASFDRERVEKLEPEIYALRARIQHLESERKILLEEIKNIRSKIDNI